MTVRTLIARSLRFHWRSHLGVVLGAAVGSAALIGALIVGDSVRESLRERALERLGAIAFALSSPDRFVTDHLATEMPSGLRASWREASDTWVYYETRPADALSLPALAATADSSARANRVNLIGVSYDPNNRSNTYVCFWHFGKDPPIRIQPGEVWLNEALASQLHAKIGDAIVFRVHKPSALSRDTPITPRTDASVALRLRVAGVRASSGLGNLSLRASQVPPFNAFVNLEELQQATALAHRVNLLVAPGIIVNTYTGPSRLEVLLEKIKLQRFARRLFGEKWHYKDASESLKDFADDLKSNVRLEDYELSIRPAPSNSVGLVTSRIFLDESITQAATHPALEHWRRRATDENSPEFTNGTLTATQKESLANIAKAQPVLTYLVNLMQAGTRATPYSMVTAAGAPFTPPEMKDNEILVNDWLAADLQVKPGDTIALTYFVADSGAALVERTNAFHVHGIVPMAGRYDDRTLMPEFPGIAKAESTHDWDAGFALVHTIRPQDETYWKQHRGTPKAFVTLAAGRRMWTNRFGETTAVRWPVPNGVSSEFFSRMIGDNLLNNLDPSELGLRFEPVREQALRAVSQSQDFGGLFIGFSFFLIIATLILMGLLFRFGIEQRIAEIGTLLALGFTAKRVRRLFLFEGGALAFLGGIAGTAGGVAYAKLMLQGLTTVWRGATNTSALTFHVSILSLATGFCAAVVVAVFTIWIVLRKQARQPARVLLAGEWKEEFADFPSGPEAGKQIGRGGRFKWLGAAFHARVIAWISLGLAVATVVSAFAAGETSNPEYFFSAGSFALIAGLALVSWLLARMLRRPPRHHVSNSSLSVRGVARRKTRSVATVALLACGVFLIAAIGAFRLDATDEAWKRSSGTGGFALIGESTLPIVKDLNTREGRDALGLNEKILEGVSFVPFRVRDGDDASCLNLNRAQQPRLLGVKGENLSQRFTFAKAPDLRASGLINKDDAWLALEAAGFQMTGTLKTPTDRTVPAIGDAASIQWALGKKIGDTLTYPDEHGGDFNLRLVGGLANSIMQGSLIVDEAEFTKHFPGISGYRMFLIDCPSNALPAVSAELTRALEDYGFEVTPAARRLAAFNAVQNTYLNTFQVLGGLGLLLGSAGLGIVVLRNVLERRGELALLIAVGFRRPRVQKLVLVEHAALLCFGLLIGLISALVAVLPSLISRAELPVRSLALTLGGVLLFGLISTWLATRAAIRGNLLEGLRNE